RLDRPRARLADRLDRLLALRAVLPAASQDRAAGAASGRAPCLDRPRRGNRHVTALSLRAAERERESVRLVRRGADGDRLRLRDDPDVPRLPGLLPRPGPLASGRNPP